MENKIIRYGYGNNFNDIIINGENIIKRSKNKDGNVKINHEINFYKYIKSNNIHFSTPKIVEFGENFYSMEYLNSTIPLYKYLQNKDVDYIYIFIKKLYTELENLHSSGHKKCGNAGVRFREQ